MEYNVIEAGNYSIFLIKSRITEIEANIKIQQDALSFNLENVEKNKESIQTWNKRLEELKNSLQLLDKKAS